MSSHDSTGFKRMGPEPSALQTLGSADRAHPQSRGTHPPEPEARPLLGTRPSADLRHKARANAGSRPCDRPDPEPQADRRDERGIQQVPIPEGKTSGARPLGRQGCANCIGAQIRRSVPHRSMNRPEFCGPFHRRAAAPQSSRKGRIHRSAWLVDSSQYLSETSPHFHALARSSMTITPWRDVFRLLPQNRAPSGQSNYSCATQQRWRVRVVSIQGFVYHPGSIESVRATAHDVD